MKWINKHLGRLSYATGVQAVTLGACLGFVMSLVAAALNGASPGWLVLSAFAGTLPGAIITTALACLAASLTHLGELAPIRLETKEECMRRLRRTER